MPNYVVEQRHVNELVILEDDRIIATIVDEETTTEQQIEDATKIVAALIAYSNA